MLNYSATGAQSLAGTNVFSDTASFVIANEGITTISYSAYDHALNQEATKTLVVRVDLTDPTVALGTAYPAPNAAGWNNTDVNVPFTATDTPSGIASTAPPSSPLVLTDEGAAKLRAAADTHLSGIDEQFLSRYSEPELATLAELLGRLPSTEGDCRISSSGDAPCS